MTISRALLLPLLCSALAGNLVDGLALEPEGETRWRIAEPGYTWSFPEDHWAHSGYQTEWWYFTGHLTVDGEQEPRFGYQFTFFRVGLTPGESRVESSWATHVLIMGHASISDLREGRHIFSDVLYRDVPLLGGFGQFPDSLLAWCRGPAGTTESWTLSWNGNAFDFSMSDRTQGIAFDLSTHPEKPMIFQGPEGYSRKGPKPSQASLYYSFTRLETAGRLTMDGETFAVEGRSWMDKEIGSNQLGENQVGWDWFSLQLDDGREVMIYEMRDADGAVDFSRGTFVSVDGRPGYLDKNSWKIRVTDTWESPKTGIRYPSGWEIDLPGEGMSLRVRPIIPGQENRSDRSSGLTYWEGAVEILDVTGPVGRGYVELTGYGARNRPAL